MLNNSSVKFNVVIPFLRNLDLLGRCVESIKCNPNLKNIYVVNSGRESIKDYFDDPIIIEVFADENFWWAAAANSGIQLSILSGVKYTLLINADNYFESNSLELLIELAENHHIDVLGSMVRYNNGKVKHCGVKVEKKLGRQIFVSENCHQYESDFSGKINEIDSLGGQGVLIRNEVFRTVGLFNALKLPHYSADLDFYLRLKEVGYKIYCARCCIVIDDIGSTGLIRANGFNMIDMLKVPFSIRSHLHYKNQWYLCRRHWRLKSIAFIYVYLKFFGATFKKVVFSKWN